MHFLGNGDGPVTSLNSKKAKCNLLFAVHTVKCEQNEFGITYVKEGRLILCDVAMTFNKLENLSLIYLFTPPRPLLIYPPRPLIPESTFAFTFVQIR